MQGGRDDGGAGDAGRPGDARGAEAGAGAADQGRGRPPGTGLPAVRERDAGGQPQPSAHGGVGGRGGALRARLRTVSRLRHACVSGGRGAGPARGGACVAAPSGAVRADRPARAGRPGRGGCPAAGRTGRRGVDAAPRGAAAGRAGAGDQGAGRGALRDSGGKGLPRGQGAGPAGAQHADHRDRRLEHPGAGLLGGDARAPGGGGGRRALALGLHRDGLPPGPAGDFPPATGRSSPTGAMSPPARGSPTSGGSCTRRRSSAGSSRPRRPWSSETAPPGSGISPETSSPRPGSGSTSSM